MMLTQAKDTMQSVMLRIKHILGLYEKASAIIEGYKTLTRAAVSLPVEPNNLAALRNTNGAFLLQKWKRMSLQKEVKSSFISMRDPENSFFHYEKRMDTVLSEVLKLDEELENIIFSKQQGFTKILNVENSIMDELPPEVTSAEMIEDRDQYELELGRQWFNGVDFDEETFEFNREEYDESVEDSLPVWDQLRVQGEEEEEELAVPNSPTFWVDELKKQYDETQTHTPHPGTLGVDIAQPLLFWCDEAAPKEHRWDGLGLGAVFFPDINRTDAVHGSNDRSWCIY